MPRPKQRTPALRDEVLRAAMVTLAEHGVAGLTTRRVAERASTSVPAVYELFGDKGGLVREMFFDGFRQLGAVFEDLAATDDPVADLEHALRAFRRFAQDNPPLAHVMFARAFADFDPGPDDAAAGAATRRFVIGRVRRCVDAGALAGDPTDIAHVLIALAQGLATQEAAGWLGSSRASVNRRWTSGVEAVLRGYRPPAPG